MGRTCSTNGRDYSEDLGVDGRKVWTGRIWLRIGTSGGLLKHGNEPSSSLKGGEFD